MKRSFYFIYELGRVPCRALSIDSKHCQHGLVHVLSSVILSAVQDVIDMTYSFGMRQSRGSLARTIYNRMAVDEQHRVDDHAYWYTVDLQKLPEELCEKFLQCHQDSETTDFLDNCYNKADWVFTQIGHSLARSFLSWFMAATSINGLLGRGSMFVFSRSQFMKLLDISAAWKGENLLDLGAGDGEVTKMMSPNFRNVYATETSFSMVSRLKHRGYKILDISGWDDGSVLFDVVSCLNLLDRCDQPISILHSIKRSLKPDGILVVAIVLPFKPYVEFGSASNKPSQNIILNGTSFEEQVTSLVKDVFEPAGFSLVKFTRLPYLCEGDMETSFYVLDDAVFVLRVTEERPV